MQRKVACAWLVVLGLGVVACGSSSTLSAADFRARAGAICKRVDAQVIALAKAAASSDRAAKLHEAHAVVQHGVTELEALAPPSELRPKFAQFKTAVALWGAAALELAKPHPHLDAATSEAMNPHRPRSMWKLARSLGIDSC